MQLYRPVKEVSSRHNNSTWTSILSSSPASMSRIGLPGVTWCLFTSSLSDKQVMIAVMQLKTYELFMKQTRQRLIKIILSIRNGRASRRNAHEKTTHFLICMCIVQWNCHETTKLEAVAVNSAYPTMPAPHSWKFSGGKWFFFLLFLVSYL